MAEVIDIMKRDGAKLVPPAPTSAEPGAIWAEAHKALDELQRLNARPLRVFFVLDGVDIGVVHVGAPCRPSDAAGLLFTAATLVTTDAGEPTPRQRT